MATMVDIDKLSAEARALVVEEVEKSSKDRLKRCKALKAKFESECKVDGLTLFEVLHEGKNWSRKRKQANPVVVEVA